MFEQLPRTRSLLATGLAVLVGCAVMAAVIPALRDDDRRAAPGPSSSAPQVGAVQTSAASGSLMEPLAVQGAPAADTDQLDITVDPTAAGQTIRGFGAAMTHSSAELIEAMPAEERQALLRELFSPEGPARLTAIRIPIGASDFIPGDPFTLDDLGVGESDWQLERFDLSPDRQALLPVLQQVAAINPDVTIIASPWSPPAWLKDGGTLEGGRLLDDDRAYETYAEYLVRYVQEYADAGVDIDYLTVQNEPQLRHPDGYPGTDMPYWQAAELIDRLGPALREAGVTTEILGFDHNWELNPEDAATTPAGEDPAYQYAADLLRSEASEWITGTAYHCYYGDASSMTRLWEEFPDQELWVTECSGSHAPGVSSSQVFADTLAWQSEHLMIASLRNRASAVLDWNFALDSAGGPHRGGCSTCTGLVTIGDDATVDRHAEYAVLAHVARYVPAGSVRVDSSVTDLPNVAFRTPTNRTVVVLWNPDDDERQVAIGDGRLTVHAQVAAKSLVTLAWGP